MRSVDVILYSEANQISAFKGNPLILKNAKDDAGYHFLILFNVKVEMMLLFQSVNSSKIVLSVYILKLFLQ